MFKHLIRIPTLKMSREKWLRERKSHIGGSDAAAIVGLNEYSSPVSVWGDKTNRLPEAEDNEAMRQGRDLEDYVAKRFTEKTGKRVRRENAILINPDLPFAHANVDRMVIGEDAGLECKTTSSLNLRKFKNGEYPDRYYVQCMHYMMVTGAKKWYLAVLVFGRDFYVYEIERDEDEIEALKESEAGLWGYVERDEMPPADGSAGTDEAIAAIYPNGDGTECDLTAFETDVDTRIRLKSRIKELETDVKSIDNRIKAFMGMSETGFLSEHKVTFKNTTRSTLDLAAFGEAHPDIDLSPFYKTSTFRTFKIV